MVVCVVFDLCLCCVACVYMCSEWCAFVVVGIVLCGVVCGVWGLYALCVCVFVYFLRF